MFFLTELQANPSHENSWSSGKGRVPLSLLRYAFLRPLHIRKAHEKMCCEPKQPCCSSRRRIRQTWAWIHSSIHGPQWRVQQQRSNLTVTLGGGGSHVTPSFTSASITSCSPSASLPRSRSPAILSVISNTGSPESRSATSVQNATNSTNCRYLLRTLF